MHVGQAVQWVDQLSLAATRRRNQHQPHGLAWEIVRRETRVERASPFDIRFVEMVIERKLELHPCISGACCLGAHRPPSLIITTRFSYTCSAAPGRVPKRMVLKRFLVFPPKGRGRRSPLGYERDTDEPSPSHTSLSHVT